MTKTEEFADQLVKLTVTELKDLETVLKEKYGLTIAQATIAQEVIAPIEAVKEKTSFNAILTKVSEETKEKLSSVKEINRITAVGLKAAMEISKNLPFKLKENVSKVEAEGVKNIFAALNATVEIE